MSGKLKINVTIAGRNYPMHIDRSREEVIRKAVDFINAQIKTFIVNHGIKDKQDALAMCCIQLANQVELSKGNVQIEENELLEQINNMHTLLDDLKA